MNRWLLLGALVVAVGCLLSHRARRNNRRLLLGTLTVAVLLFLAWMVGEPARPRPNANDEGGADTPAKKPAVRVSEAWMGSVPFKSAAGGFVSSEACRECHAEQYNSWHASFHRTMTQEAVPATVVAPLDQRAELTAYGRTCTIERRGDEFWVSMPDPDWEFDQQSRGVDLNRITSPPRVERQIVMTTGSHHLQAYWVGGRNGALRQVPWEYHIEEQRWMPVEDVFLRPPDKGRMFGRWNDKCIQCHSVNGVPGMSPPREHFQTSVAELGIACEACHGPGKQHIAARRAGTRFNASEMINPGTASAPVSAQVCGQCHATFQPTDRSQFLERGLDHRAGEGLTRSRELATFDHPMREEMEKTGVAVYWGDGACRVGGAEYLGLIESKCHQGQRQPASCVSCHSMHNSPPKDQLGPGMQGNQACLQCHQEYTDVAAHTHHAPDSSGSLCYNCHMPHTTYALLNAQRTHRIDSPQVRSSVDHGRPNACNLCHVDKTLGWTASKLSDWYKQEPVPLSEDEQRISATLLWLLRGDALQRALAAWHLGWEPARQAAGEDWQARFLSRLLDDEYPAVRFIAHKSLSSLPAFSDAKYDFVGSRDQRAAAQRRLAEQARSQPLQARDNPASILHSSELKPLHSVIQRLLDQRDNRPVDIPE